MTDIVLPTYYGVDWVAMALTFWSMYWIGERRRGGFLIGMVGNLFWFAFGYMVDSQATLLANAALFWLNARGYARWHRS